MLLQDILKVKGDAVYWIRPDATVSEAVQVLVEHNIGALLVCEADPAGKGQLRGIVSERDLLHAHAQPQGPASVKSSPSNKCPWMAAKVAELMTTEVITVSPGDSVEQIMDLMTTKRIRHLPVLSEGRLVGIVSIGDIVKAQHAQLAAENRFMKDYIRG